MKNVLYLSLLSLLLVGQASFGQCGPSGCGSSNRAGFGLNPLDMYSFPTAPVYQSPEYLWQSNPESPDSLALYFGSNQVGAYRISDGLYWKYENGRFTGKATPPVALPSNLPAPTRPMYSIDPAVSTNFGIDVAKMSVKPNKPCSINGQPASFEQAMDAIKNFPDDSSKLRVTAIGTPEHRARVKQQLSNAGLLDKVNYQEYAPDSVMVTSQGFVNTSPQVYMQNARNEVLHRQEGADNVAEAVRKVRPDYDPKKDPNVINPPVANPLDYVMQIYNLLPPYAWLGIAALGYYLHTQKAKSK